MISLAQIRNASMTQTPPTYLSNQILYPLVQGCETKDTKIVNLSLQVIQRLITAQVRSNVAEPQHV
jgi:Dimerisation and cyclophilin-binding domain of Mon2